MSRLCVHTLIVALAVLVFSRPLAAAERPNILFIFTDDHAAHSMSCYGSKINKTPNLDRIANEGMRFDRCYCTNSICGPSRAVIQTGKHSHVNGFMTNGNTFDGRQQTFPRLLRNVGYQTAVIGKWHLKSAPQGFDYWQVLIGQGPYYNPPMMEGLGDPSNASENPAATKVGQRNQHVGYTTDIITDIALDFLKNKRDQNKPFMLMYQHKAPHRNWQPGPKYLTMYDDVEIPEPDNLFDDYSGRGTAARTQDMSIAKTMTPYDLKLTPPRGLNAEQLAVWNAAYAPKNKAFEESNLQGKDLIRWKYQRYMKDYLRCVASVDDNVGRVLDYLDESGLARNTIVIYSSDQGFYLGDHGWFDKRFMYEESYRMPLVARWPGKIKPGSVNNDLVSNVDFAETFLDVAGVKIPSDMHGYSLTPLFGGKTPADWRKSLYYHYYEYPGAHSVRRHFGVHTGRYKLMNFYNVGEWEMYDLEKDPREMKSVYADESYQKIAADLKSELKRLQAKFKVPDDSGSIPKDGIKRKQRNRNKAKKKAAA
jgi:arylsulfatase A-like enzyme